MRSSGKGRSERGLALLAVAALCLHGCTDSSPTEPNSSSSMPSNPTPAPVAAGTWNLTATVSAASGSFCIHLPAVGSTSQTTFTLSKNGDSLSFLMADPFDWEPYTAKLAGLNFTASAAVDSGMGMCSQYRQVQSLTGNFSADGNQLTATETWTFTLDTGEMVTRTFTWSARKIS